MKKYKNILLVLLSFIALNTCASYKLELVSDENKNRNINTQYPNYVNMLVRVTNNRITTSDSEGNTVPDFSNPEYYVVDLEPENNKSGQNAFSVIENDVEVKVEAGLRVVPLEELELHINILMDVSGSMGETGLLHEKNAVKRLIARPCTEAEIAAGDPASFNYQYLDWDPATKSVIKRNEVWKSILKENQIVKIFTFADTVKILKLSEIDDKGKRFPDKTRQILYSIDNNIQLGVDSTNLYGAMLKSLEDLRAVRSLNDPKQGFVDGVVVAFTDGSHTAGNIQHNGAVLTPKQAIQRILALRGERSDLKSLRIITIAVDTPELSETIKTGDLAGGGLRDIQNAGFLRVDDYQSLKDKFTEAFTLIDRYTRSLYWIYYRSPKSGFQDVKIKVTVQCPCCEKDENGNIPEYATIVETIKTNGFYQILPGVYINDPILDEKGLPAQILNTEGENIALLGPEKITVATDPQTNITSSRVYSLIRANNPDKVIKNSSNTALLRLHSYVRANDNRYKPEYKITSSDDSVVSVIGYAALTAIESVALIECQKPGTATIKVVDTANGNIQKTVQIISEVE